MTPAYPPQAPPQGPAYKARGPPQKVPTLKVSNNPPKKSQNYYIPLLFRRMTFLKNSLSQKITFCNLNGIVIKNKT